MLMKKEIFINKAMNDACANMVDDDPMVQDAPITRATRSGKTVMYYVYDNLSRYDIKVSWIEKSALIRRPEISSKRLKYK